MEVKIREMIGQEDKENMEIKKKTRPKKEENIEENKKNEFLFFLEVSKFTY